jgi:o-succinylbenzoate synthase
MRIVAADVVPLVLTLRRPLMTAQGAIGERHGFLLRLQGDDGTVGVGEASPAYWIGEGSLERTAEDLDRIVRLARARPSLAALRCVLDDDLTLAPAAACAVDGALLALAAEACGVAVATLLGGTGLRPVPIAALIGGARPDAIAGEAAEATARGHTTLKLKVGAEDLATDRARLAAVRGRVGNGIALRLDANQAWTFADAERALAAFAPFEPEYVEEPLRDGTSERLASLARATPVALAVDESITTAADLEAIIAAKARVHVVLKASRIGGPTRLVALARRAVAAGRPVVVTDAIESAVGMRAAVHAAAAVAGGAAAAVGLGGAQLAIEHAILRGPWLVPSGPAFAVTTPAAGEEPERA